MITPFIDRGAWLEANSRPVADTSTSPIVSSAYGSTCQVIDTASPPSIHSCSMPAAIQAVPENAMPAPIRRSAVTSIPARRSSGYSTRLLNGISSITRIGFSACICAAENQSGLAMSSPCSTQVEAFWSNSDQNRSEEHTSELQSLMRISYAVFCLKKKNTKNKKHKTYTKNSTTNRYKRN